MVSGHLNFSNIQFQNPVFNTWQEEQNMPVAGHSEFYFSYIKEVFNLLKICLKKNEVAKYMSK